MKRTRIVLIDIAALALVILLSYYFYGYLLQGEFLKTYYADWFYHAFRTKVINTYGFTSWLHIVDNGNDFWQSYQFLPHYFSALVSNIFNISEARALLYASFGALAFLHTTFYLVLRKSGVDTYKAIVGTILITAINQLNRMTGDYTILIAAALLPVNLYLLYLDYKSENKYLFPAVVYAFSLYIHPILSFFTAGFWIVLFVFQKNKNYKKFAVKLGVFAIVASHFILASFFYTGVSYVNYNLLDPQFLRSMFITGLGSPSVTVYVFIVISVIFLLLKINTISKLKKFIFPSFIYLFALITWVILTLNYEVPAFLNQFQVTRWPVFIAISFIFVIIIALQKLADQGYSDTFIKISLFFILFLFFIENTNREFNTSVLNSRFDLMNEWTDGANEFIKDVQPGEKNLRIHSVPPTTTLYFNFGDLFAENNYFHLSQNPYFQYRSLNEYHASGIPEGGKILYNYFRSRGVRYVFIVEPSGINEAFQKGILAGNLDMKFIGKVDNEIVDKYVYEIHPQSIHAISYSNDVELIDSNVGEFYFDTEQFNKTSLYFEYFSQFLNEGKYEVIAVEYPSQEEIFVPKVGANSTALLFTNYDTNWELENSSQQFYLEKGGPSYLKVVNNTNADKQINLTHKMPLSTIIGFYSAAVGILVAIILSLLQIYKFKSGKLKRFELL